MRVKIAYITTGFALVLGVVYSMVGSRDCEPVVVRAKFRMSPIGHANLFSADLDVPAMIQRDGGWRERKFAQVVTRARLCATPDAGGVLEYPFDDDGLEPYGVIEFLSDAGHGPDRPILDERCACRRRGGSCHKKTGVTVIEAPVDTELQPGTFVGPDCIRKTCGEVAGDQGQSMPEECR